MVKIAVCASVLAAWWELRLGVNCLGQTEICKKMIKRMGNAFKITFTEMSVMYDYFATAEEDDMWKSWGTIDDYLEVLTLRYTMDEECEQLNSSDESE